MNPQAMKELADVMERHGMYFSLEAYHTADSLSYGEVIGTLCLNMFASDDSDESDDIIELINKDIDCIRTVTFDDIRNLAEKGKS